MLGRFATGVTVVTSISRGEPVGMTCQTFKSVSLDPPLVLFCPRRPRGPGRRCSGRDSSASTSWPRARSQSPTDGPPWGRQVRRARLVATPETGAPLLDGVLGWVDCTVYAVHEAGDHYVVIGRVQDLDATRDGEPLLFYRGGYRTTGG